MAHVLQKVKHVAERLDELSWKEASMLVSRWALIAAALYLFLFYGLEAMGQGAVTL